MNPNWLFPIGLVLMLTLMGLTGASKPIARVDLWLDQRDAPLTAEANALNPLVECLNRVDVRWRLSYEAYVTQRGKQSIEQWIADRRDYADDRSNDLRTLQGDYCSAKLSDKLTILQFELPLATLADRYVQALRDVAPLTARIDYYESKRLAPGGPPTTEPETSWQTQAQAYLDASTPLRQQVERLDLEQRRGQLQLIEARLHHDIHWHLLAYMIQARDTLNQLSDGLKNRSLTPEQLGSATEQLQRAWAAKQQFRSALLPSKSAEDARALWDDLIGPSQHYLDALNTLHQDWRNKAEPQRLSDDYYAVTRGYDSMISHYNRLARVQF